MVRRWQEPHLYQHSVWVLHIMCEGWFGCPRIGRSECPDLLNSFISWKQSRVPEILAKYATPLISFELPFNSGQALDTVAAHFGVAASMITVEGTRGARQRKLQLAREFAVLCLQIGCRGDNNTNTKAPQPPLKCE